MPTAAILSQGDEVVTGQITDTNAAWLAAELTELGFDVVLHLTVGDRLADIVRAFTWATREADVCVCTGGLGPTDDDLTAAAAAEAFGRPLVEDAIAWQRIQAYFEALKRRMAPINRKQAQLPSGAARLDNDWGTAPGFALEHGRSWLFCLPGVPREMRPMFDARVRPRLSTLDGVTPGRLVTLRTVGIGESELQERIGPFHQADVVLGYRTISPENLVKLRFTPNATDARVHEVTEHIARAIGDAVFTIEGLSSPLPGWDVSGGSLAEVIGRALAARGETLAVAESCTGGRVAAACTAVPGASAWFLEAAVVYADASKVRQAGVTPELLRQHGAVSEAVARALAEGFRARTGATYGLAITGIAGPGGATPTKPIGTVHLALAAPWGTRHRALAAGGDRARIQGWSAAAALDLLRRSLQPQTP